MAADTFGVRSVKVAAILWLTTICFVPIWLGANFVVYFYPASVVGLLVVVVAVPGLPRMLGTGDLVAGFLFLSCLAPIVSGGATKTTIFVALSQWLLAFLLGRTLPLRIGLEWLYQCLAVLFAVVAALAIIEFVFGWNPFVLIRVPGALFQAWAKIQTRGGVPRAEGAFGHSIALGASVALVVPIALAAKFRLWIRLVITALLLACTAVTFSRTAMICAVLAVLFTVAFLQDGLSNRVRGYVVLVVAVLAAVLAPFVTSVFTLAGDEATNSAAYRGDLTSLIPNLSILGFSSDSYRSPSGDLYFGRFQSIDSQLILTGLTYGWLAAGFGLILLAGALLAMLRRRASPATIAVVAQIPALATVALITQYSMFFWFIAGLATMSQVRRHDVPSPDRTATGGGEGWTGRSPGSSAEPSRPDDGWATLSTAVAATTSSVAVIPPHGMAVRRDG